MTKSHLRPCAACARHIRVSELACPFCRAEQSAAARTSPAPLAPRARLTRAAMFALGTSAAAVASGCGAQASESKVVDDAGQGAADTGTDAPIIPVPSYGQPGPPVQEDASGGALYGAPPITDDAGPADAGPADAGPTEWDAMGGAAYGAPGMPVVEDAGGD